MSEWSDDVLANHARRDRRPLLEAILFGTPAVAAALRIRPNDGIAQATPLALRDDAMDGEDADAIAGIRRALQARGLVLTGARSAPAQQATQYRDPRAYQAYIEEIVCLT
jgi:hypothetical protein